MVVQRTESAGAKGAKFGKQPAGAGAGKITIVADVTAIDPATQTVTLKGPERTVDLRIPTRRSSKG